MEELERLIPYLVESKLQPLHSLKFTPYPNILLALPGKYGDKTKPKGGDFVVQVTCDSTGWQERVFKHTELFWDVECRAKVDAMAAQQLMAAYLSVVHGTEPEEFGDLPEMAGRLRPLTFLRAAQCLALAEHRRYSHMERYGGGKWLPWRFAHGIATGRWSTAQAAEEEKRGRRGIEALEGETGMPPELRQLLSFQSLERD